MGRLVWIVSYPRSGNTFVRALLTQYLSGERGPLDLDELSRRTVGEGDESLWTALTGQRPEHRTVEAQWRARPAYLAHTRAAATAPLTLFKSHTPNVIVLGVPAFDFQPEDRIIHVTRDPFDVALSVAAYNDLTIDAAISQLLQHNTVVDARPNWGFEVIGSWAQHALSWEKTRHPHLHRVRYLDLVEDARSELEKIIRFLGLPVDAARLDRAVESTRFETLAGQERAGGFSEAIMAKSGGFFRVGRPLQFVDQMSDEQVDRLVLPLRALIERLGFDHVLQARDEARRRTASA